MASNFSFPAGIDDLAFNVPKLFLPLADLAEKRDLEYAKLNKGLGLHQMAVPDVHEDAATLAANAVVQLIDRNNLNPSQIGRIYIGTESAWDGAKPVASNVLEMLQAKYEAQFGRDCWLNCDVADLTFACIGGVDALENTIDWVRGSAGRIGIVVSTDIARYELGSTGEYTQGAGAVAALVCQNPRLLAIEDAWGVATKGVYDFYKPVRPVDKIELIEEVLRLAGMGHLDPEDIISRLPEELEIRGVLDDNDHYLFLHKDAPVFDGPYSNACYQERTRQALEDFRRKANATGLVSNGHTMLDRWERLVFHLPYAFQAKRMFPEIFYLEMERTEQARQWLKPYGLEYPKRDSFASEQEWEQAYAQFLKGVSLTEEYKAYVQEKIEKGQRASGRVGNLYTGSIFLALMSTLESDLHDGEMLEGKRFGFFAYGSGSKSKVFEGLVQPQWREVVKAFGLFSTLDQRQAIGYDTYDKLHRGVPFNSYLQPKGSFALTGVSAGHSSIGVRSYVWVEKTGVKA
ncbi:MAG: hydroxymethylglutaryl-CoA synthase [Saprospiraceae bacterium]